MALDLSFVVYRGQMLHPTLCRLGWKGGDNHHYLCQFSILSNSKLGKAFKNIHIHMHLYIYIVGKHKHVHNQWDMLVNFLIEFLDRYMILGLFIIFQTSCWSCYMNQQPTILIGMKKEKLPKVTWEIACKQIKWMQYIFNFLFRNLCLETILKFIIDQNKCGFNREYAVEFLNDCK